MSGPAFGERPVAFTLASGEVIVARVVDQGPAGLRVRLADGFERTLGPGEVTDRALVAGPLRAPEAPRWPVELVPLDGAGSALAALGGAPAWALLDGVAEARAAGLPVEAAIGLLAGHDDRGPHLLALDADTLPAAIERGLAGGWATLLRAPGPARPLAHHLRSFLRVTDARTGATVHFRVAQGAALRAALPALDAAHVGALFGSPRCDEQTWTCAVCDTPLEPPARDCPWCDARLGGGDEAPVLVEALIVPGAPPLLARPWPDRPRDGFAPPARGRRGRARLALGPRVLEAIAWDFARRAGRPGLDAALVEHAVRAHAGLAAHVGQDVLAARARATVERAATYRVFKEANVTCLFDVHLLLGQDAELDPGAWTWREAARQRSTHHARARWTGVARRHHRGSARRPHLRRTTGGTCCRIQG